MNEYHEQAEKFLTANGIKFRATLSDSKPPPWSSEPGSHPSGELHGHHYRVTLSRSKPSYRLYEEIAEQPKPLYRLTFDFWGSIADAEAGKTDIQPYDVLACISGDVSTPDTFEDFCSEFGYDTDSIKAKQMFTRCSNFASRLRAFFTEAEQQQLQEIQ